jgi:hypothetical protein
MARMNSNSKEWERLLAFVEKKAEEHLGVDLWATVKDVAPQHVRQTGIDIEDKRGQALLALGLFLGSFYVTEIGALRKEERQACQHSETA